MGRPGMRPSQMTHINSQEQRRHGPESPNPRPAGRPDRLFRRVGERETRKQNLPLLIRNRPVFRREPDGPEPVRQLPFRIPALRATPALIKMDP
jgi:hypothetical protein